MAERPAAEGSYDLVCPHCGKSFEAELLTGGSDRTAGFKCPHCRLFIAFERAGIDDEDQEAT